MKFRSERERLIVVWGSVVGVLLLWWSLFLSPALKVIHDTQVLLPQRRADVEQAREIAAQLAVPVATKLKAPVVPTIDTIIHQLHISSEHVKNLKDVGRGAQVQLSDIDGGTLMRLLHALEQHGIRPDSAEFHDFANNGMWDVTLTVNGTP